MLKASYSIDIDFDDASARERLAAKLEEIILRHWQDDQGSDGEWADLSPATWARKTTNKKLLETGKMIDSLKVYENTPDRIRVGFGVDYAPYHEYGTDKMPQRESLWLSKEELGELTDVLLEVANDD